MEFRDATKTDFAYDSMIKTMSALALTGVELSKDPELLKAIRKEFETTKK